MQKIKISAVSYLNSAPFIYGLEQSGLMDEIELSLDNPSVCAQKLLDDKADLGLIPVAIIPFLKEHYIIGDHCIGAEKKVGSVMFYSHVPLTEIKKVLLDPQSRTSVALLRILAANFWKIEPEWIISSENYENSITGTTAGLIIGDRTFGLDNTYPYAYDLAEEWEKYTGLPFVFACWVANKKLAGSFIEKFNAAIKMGVDHRPALIEKLNEEKKYGIDVSHYLLKSISYSYDDTKKRALQLFLNYLIELEQ